MNPSVSRDERWMRHALDLARTAWGETHPNPMVGAILVDDADRILAQGFHARAGELHAERAALQSVSLSKEQVDQATLYVTLEPCCTQGRTPPCTQIILEKGIRRVVVGAIDPNPQHCARGIDQLRGQGIEVVTGVLERECRSLNPIFHHRMETGHPLIALKTAVTLDGRVATAAGASQWITGAVARQDVMQWRRYFPAIGVGAGTVLADNPSLTVRETGRPVTCRKRWIFDRSLRTAPAVASLKVFQDKWAAQTCLVTDDTHGPAELAPFHSRGIEVVRLPLRSGCFPLDRFRELCGQRGIDGIYLEGGSGLASDLLAARAIDYLFCYHAPKLFASHAAPGIAEGLEVRVPEQAPFVEDPQFEILGPDVLTHGFLRYPSA